MKIPGFGETLPGLAKIQGVISKFQEMSVDLSDGITMLQTKKSTNADKIQTLESENVTISNEVSRAQYVLKQIDVIVNKK